MVYASVFYNFEYAAGCDTWLKNLDADNVKTFLKEYFVYYIIFIVIALRMVHKDYLSAAALFVTALLESYLFLSGHLFNQYPMICLVQVTLFLNELLLLIKASQPQERIIGIFLVCWLVQFLYNDCFYAGVMRALDVYESGRTYTERDWEPIFEEVPKEDLDSFIAYGGNYFKELYLLENIMPCYKYFAIQKWHASFSDKIRNDIYNTFKNGDAKWILAEESTAVIDSVLDDNYVVWDETEDYKLYTLKSNINLSEYSREWTFGNGQYISKNGGMDTEEGRVLYPNGYSYGPYWTIPAGNYTLEISGDGLNELIEIATYSDHGAISHEFEVLERSDTKIVLKLSFETSAKDIEIFIMNHNQENITLKEMKLSRIE